VAGAANFAHYNKTYGHSGQEPFAELRDDSKIRKKEAKAGQRRARQQAKKPSERY
jgi:hypothetical protein